MQRLVRGHESSLRSDFCDHGLGPRGTARQRKQGDGRCCLALHVTKPKPLNRNFQSWRCLVIAPLTAHTKTLCFYYRRPVSFPRKSLHEQSQNHPELHRWCVPALSLECASLGVSCLVDKLRFIHCEVAACLPFTFTCPQYKELPRSTTDLLSELFADHHPFPAIGCSIIPKQPPPTRHLHQHSQHGSHILASVRPSLGKEGDENSHGWSRCRRKDHHPLQVEAR